MASDIGVDAKYRVTEALKKDVGRAIVRLDPDAIERLGAQIGDTVEVTGKRRTVCKVMPTYKELRGQSRAQMDGIIRENTGAALDEFVVVAKKAVPAAARVTLAPTTITPDDRDMRYIGSLLDGIPVTSGDLLRVTLFGSRWADFRVEATQPAGSVIIGASTELVVGKTAPAGKGAASGKSEGISYEDIGGLRSQLSRIREMVELPLRYPEVFERLGIDPPRGVLLHGPPGCGKTLIARAIARETEAAFFSVSGPEIVHKFYGESEAHLRRIFEEATRKGPSIVFLDEIDAIAPRREQVVGDVEKRIVAQLLALMDGLTQRRNVVVIGATNIPNALDPALRRPGRFDREIAIPIPDRYGRQEILDVHSRGMPLASDVDMKHVAEITHGFVGADLSALCREAAMACLRKILPEIDFALTRIPYERLAAIEVHMDDFQTALKDVEPSATREVFVEVPEVHWDDVGGLEGVKQRLVETVQWPLKHADVFEAAGVKPAKGVLFAGPPGVGKTLLAKALASESGVNFISIKGPEVLSKFVGESERGIRELFHKARQASPCIIFMDEIDALIPARGMGSSDSHVSERVLSQFLAEMDGIEELRGILVLGATNRPDMLDPAALRPGRFDEVVDIPLPDEAARAQVFAVHLRGKPMDGPVDTAALAARTPGFSGADIAGACATAARRAVRRTVEVRLAEGFEDGIAPATAPGPVVTTTDLDQAIADIMHARRGAEG
jgi:transitional endoplasmic reticulum ATPase